MEDEHQFAVVQWKHTVSFFFYPWEWPIWYSEFDIPRHVIVLRLEKHHIDVGNQGLQLVFMGTPILSLLD